MAAPLPPSPPAPVRRAALIAVATAGMAAGTSAQFAIPALGPLILPELGLTRAQLGTLTAAFYLVGGAASPAAGRVCDRLGGRRVLVGTFALGALALAGLGLAPAYALLLTAMALGGLAAATANPATNRLILTSIPPGVRGAAVGFKQSGVQLAMFLSGAVLPPAAVAIGWRPTLLVSGAVLALGVPMVLLSVPRATDRGRGRNKSTIRPSRDPTIIAVSGYALLMGLGLAAVTTYLPVYAVERLSLTVTTAGLVTALVGIGGIAARVVWGLVADRLRSPMTALPILAGAAAVSVALLAAAPAVGVWALWAGAGVLGTTALGWNGVAMLVAMTAVAEEHSGWATGRVILAFYLGLVLSPVPFGWSADRTGEYGLGWLGVAVAFAVAAVVTARRARTIEAARASQQG